MYKQDGRQLFAGSQVFTCHFLCNIISNNIACGWLTIEYGWFATAVCTVPSFASSAFSLAVPVAWFICMQGNCEVIEAFHQLYKLTAESAVRVSHFENSSFWVVGSWAAPMRNLVFLMYLSRGIAAYAYTVSYGVSLAIRIKKKKRICLFVFRPPHRMVLKAEVSFTMEKIDKNILIFVKIFLDFFQGIAKTCQVPPFSSPALPQILPFLAKKSQVWDFFDRQCQPKHKLFSLIFPLNF